MISCKEAVTRLYAYLDKNLGRMSEGEVEEHLKVCRHCCGELEFAKQVRNKLRRAGRVHEMSPQTKTRITTFLRDLKAHGRTQR